MRGSRWMACRAASLLRRGRHRRLSHTAAACSARRPRPAPPPMPWPWPPAAPASSPPAAAPRAARPHHGSGRGPAAAGREAAAVGGAAGEWRAVAGQSPEALGGARHRLRPTAGRQGCGAPRRVAATTPSPARPTDLSLVHRASFAATKTTGWHRPPVWRLVPGTGSWAPRPDDTAARSAAAAQMQARANQVQSPFQAGQERSGGGARSTPRSTIPSRLCV